jgi:hypothetical protein
MGQGTKANGKTTNSMDEVKKHGLTVPNMKASTSSARNMAMEHFSGQMARPTLAIFTTIIFMAEEYTLGQTGDDTKVNGRTTRCTEKVHFSGQMVASTSASTLTIRNKALVSSFGPMADHTKETGYLVNSMDKALTLHRKAKKRLENGKMASALSGSLKKNEINIGLIN